MSYESYHRFLQTLVSAVQEEADADAQVAITGLKGTGKSTFALGAAMRIEKFFGRKFSLEDNVLWTYKDIMKGLTDESPIRAAVIDEAVLVALNRNFGKNWQKKLVQLLNTAREYHKVSFWNIPMFRRLDKGVREMFIYWVWIPRRGEALVFQRSMSPVTDDPWNLYYMDKLVKENARSECNIDDVIEALKMAPNYVMSFKFPKIDEDLRRKYKQLARKWKKAIDRIEESDEEEEEEGVQRNRIRCYLYKGTHYYSALGLARELLEPRGIPETTISGWVRESDYVTVIPVRGSERRVVRREHLSAFVSELLSRAVDWEKKKLSAGNRGSRNAPPIVVKAVAT